MKTKLFLLGCTLGLGIASSGFAATSNGIINVTLTLTNGCLVNGTPAPATGNINLGALSFGTSTTIFTDLNAVLVGSAGNGIYVRCTTGATPTVQVTGSANAAPTDVANIFGFVSTAPRYLKTAADNTRAVAYTLYPSEASTTPIANGVNLTASGTASPTLGANYPIYGRITQGGNNPLIPAGDYIDTITVAINY